MGKIKSLLWVSDGHAAPGETPEEFSRFSHVGHYIAKYKPETIVLGGDFWDNPGLNGHKGSTLLPIPGKEKPKQAARHSLIADWEAGRSAIDLILNPFKRDNERHIRAGHKERVYSPSIYYTEGNHEDFWTRLTEKHNSLEGLVSNQDAIDFLSEHKVEWIPHREKLILGGVAFQHFHPDKRGMPIPINSLLPRLLMSNVSGHNHGHSIREEVRGDGRVQTAIVAGCYKNPNRLQHGDRPGILWMEDISHGESHYKFIPQHIVARDYNRETGKYAA